jgi:hypothetical protein
LTVSVARIPAAAAAAAAKYFLLAFCSEIYPVNDHFFLLSVRDGGKDYVPVSQSVIDIPTAYAFFGLEPKETLSAVNGLVQKLIADYNEQNRNKVREKGVQDQKKVKN